MTLAGTYGEDMTPDVEMRLSFPKKSPSLNSHKVYKFPTQHKSPFNEPSQRDNTFDEYANGYGNHAALLPPPNNYNSKRSLSKCVMDGGFLIPNRRY